METATKSFWKISVFEIWTNFLDITSDKVYICTTVAGLITKRTLKVPDRYKKLVS